MAYPSSWFAGIMQNILAAFVNSKQYYCVALKATGNCMLLKRPPGGKMVFR
jgi:hypothetical protein